MVDKFMKQQGGQFAQQTENVRAVLVESQNVNTDQSMWDLKSQKKGFWIF